MAMTQKCRDTVRAAAAGRSISDARMQLLDDAISSKAQELARTNNARWRGLTAEQRTVEAAQAAMAKVRADAALKEFRASQQALRMAESQERVSMQRGINKLSSSQGISRDIEQTMNNGDAITKQSIGGMTAFLDAVESKDGTGAMRNLGMRLFDLDNPAMTADVVREVFAKADGSTGNTLAKAGAKAYLDTIESLRVRFNAAGGDIGKLGYGYLTQAHDSLKVKAAGAQAWAAKVMPLLDREQYLRPDGSRMDDAEVGALLAGAHQTLATGGANKTEPGQFRGTGARANRGSDARVLHFKDGDAWMAYMKDFGEGSLYDAVTGHIGKMSRDIALLEAYGPNPEQWFKVADDLARRADRPDGAKTLRELAASRSAGNLPEAYWNLATGKTGSPQSRLLARIGSDLRNVQTAAKITWGPFSALADVATIAQTLHFNRIPYFEYLTAVKDRFSADHKAELASHGIIAESALNTLNRFTGDHLTHSLTGRVTNGVMKLSLMNAWTDNLRGAFQDVLMHNWSSKIGKGWSELDQWDQYLMQRHGISEADWAVISKAQPIEISGRRFLMGDGIGAVSDADLQAARPGEMQGLRAGIATRWQAFIADESMFAVVNPDVATRALATAGGMPAGTFSGEVARSIMQFKSFPMGMLTRHWRRAFETPQGLEGAPLGYGADSKAGGVVNKIAVLAALGFSATLMGALQTQSRSVLTGKDPIEMDPREEVGRKFWAKSFAAGGGAGFLADVLMAPTEDPSRQWQGHFGLLGPVAGAGGGIIDVVKSKTPAAEGVKLVTDQLPFVDMWQTRAAFEHWFTHWAQESLNPGYLSRMQQRSQKQWRQQSWWAPGDALPSRMPDYGSNGP
jgi:hypothetical protein